jgi:multidrug efflux pump subunit AcrA (membrane-fusion protein)
VQGQKAEVAARRSQHEASLARIKAAESQAAVLQAAEKVALVAVAKQKLMLDRTKIVSPVDGVVLALFAAPGEKKILAMDDHKSAVVASLFQKGKLQVRVDAPLSEARQLVVGQLAVITTDYLPGVEFGGIVSRIVGSADLQRNTLQAKVRVLKPDPRLRPEMLCRVRFMKMAPSISTSAGGDVPSAAPSESRRAIMVPESALVVVAQETRKQATLWVVSPDGNSALRRPVVPGAYRHEGYLSIHSGLLAGERVILPPHDGLRDGRRLKIESVAP